MSVYSDIHHNLNAICNKRFVLILCSFFAIIVYSVHTRGFFSSYYCLLMDHQDIRYSISHGNGNIKQRDITMQSIFSAYCLTNTDFS